MTSAASEPVVTLSVSLPASDVAELQKLIRSVRRCDCLAPLSSVDDLAAFVLSSLAVGVRRPASWENQLLELLGLEAD